MKTSRRNMRPPGRRRFLFLPLLPALLAACPSTGEPDGPAILKVNSVPVGARELEREVEFRLTFTKIAAGPEDAGPDAVLLEDLKARVITECLIPLAAVKGAYGERIREIRRQAEEALDAASSDPGSFDRIARLRNQENGVPGGGGLGFFGRGSGLPYPLPQVAFSMEPGAVSEPFLSLAGCHILLVKQKIEGVTDALDRVEVSQIFFPYEQDQAFLQQTLPRLTAAARIEVLDPALQPLVQPKAP